MPNTPLDVLVIESSTEAVRAVLGHVPGGLRAEGVSSTLEAEAILDARPARVVVCADDLPGETGLMFLARTKDRWPHLRRILLAPPQDAELFFLAMGEVTLFDFLTKPDGLPGLAPAVLRAKAQYEAGLRREHSAVATEAAPPPADAPQAVARPISRDAIVLVTGVLAGCLVTLLCITALYFIKSAAGVDIFPFLHFGDLFGK